jgi:hypothetical protein
MRRGALITALCALAGVALHAGIQNGAGLDRRDADSLDRKLDQILARGAKPPAKSAKPQRTTIADKEVNAYFAFQGKQYLPVGVTNPVVTIVDTSRVEGRAIIDLDAVRKAKERGWMDLLSYVTGSVEIRAAGKFHSANGTGTFELESASIGGVPISKAFLQEVIAYYSRTADSPEGFNLDQPFKLPQQIQHVELKRGLAVIVQ